MSQDDRRPGEAVPNGDDGSESGESRTSSDCALQEPLDGGPGRRAARTAIPTGDLARAGVRRVVGVALL